MSQALDTLSNAAINNERNERPPQPKRRKHKHALSQHKHASDAAAAAVVSPVVAAPPAIIAASALARGRSRSPPASSPVSSPRASTSTSDSVDTRAFQEILNDMLHKHGEKNLGKMISDERFRRLLIACGLPKNDPQVTRSEREFINAHKIVAGVDGRLFAWKPGHVKEDVATGTWPTDMYECVRFTDIAHVIAQEHKALGGAKGWALFKSLQEKYKGITHEMCKLFCKHCPCCAKSQVDHQKTKRTRIQPIIARCVWFKITFDLICMITQAGGAEGEYLYLLTAIDHFSKYAYAWALKDKTADGVAQELRRLFMMFGYPVTTQADNGSEFKGMVAALMEEKAIIYTHGQPYKPQSQGVVERFNQTIQKRILALLVQYNETDWFNVLDKAVIAYNTTPHSTTGQTPYKIMYGQDPPAQQVTTLIEPPHEYKQEIEQQPLPHVVISAKAHATYVTKAHKIADKHNKKALSLSQYGVGQFVSVTINLGDHPNRLPQRNIGGVIIHVTQHQSYRILTLHGMIASPLKPEQFIPANPSQYPDLLVHAVKWSSPEECERTMNEDKGKSMIDIHTIMCAEAGITARLNYIKIKAAERKEEEKKTKKKRKGVKHITRETRRSRAHEHDGVKDVMVHDEFDFDSFTVDDVPGIGVTVGFGVPEYILDERMFNGVKQYYISWQGRSAKYNSWQLASDYDDGVYDGAYVELVQEWEEYRKTDPQYLTSTSTQTSSSSSSSSNSKARPHARK